MPYASITGILEDSTGNPVQSGQVVFTPLPKQPVQFGYVPGGPVSTTTASDGSFSISLQPGAYNCQYGKFDSKLLTVALAQAYSFGQLLNL